MHGELWTRRLPARQPYCHTCSRVRPDGGASLLARDPPQRVALTFHNYGRDSQCVFFSLQESGQLTNTPLSLDTTIPSWNVLIVFDLSLPTGLMILTGQVTCYGHAGGTVDTSGWLIRGLVGFLIRLQLASLRHWVGALLRCVCLESHATAQVRCCCSLTHPTRRCAGHFGRQAS